MLSKIGKLSIAIVMAGGMTLLGSDTAHARGTSCGGVPEYPIGCDATIEGAACNSTAAFWYAGDDGYYCPSYNGQCTMWCNNGEIDYEWSISYEWQETPCSPVLPC